MEGRKVDSKLLLFTLILVLIVLLLLNFLFNNNRDDGIWNYKEIVTGAQLIYSGTEVTDREIYYTLENIIKDYINSYVTDSEELSYKDYYKYLTENYKKHLNKKEYYEVAQTFLNKFLVNTGSMNTNQILKHVYELENNVYLCELVSNTTKQTAYIAIQLNTSQLIYNIVYVE